MSLSRSLVLVCSVILLLISAPLFAGDRTWTGTVGTDWRDAGNWGGTLPQNGDNLIFAGNGSSQKWMDTWNNLPAGMTFGSLTMNGFAAINGNPFSVTGPLKLDDAAVQEMLTVTAPQTWTCAKRYSSAFVWQATLNANVTFAPATTCAWHGSLHGSGNLTLAPVASDAYSSYDVYGSYGAPYTGTIRVGANQSLYFGHEGVGHGQISGPIIAQGGRATCGADCAQVALYGGQVADITATAAVVFVQLASWDNAYTTTAGTVTLGSGSVFSVNFDQAAVNAGRTLKTTKMMIDPSATLAIPSGTGPVLAGNVLTAANNVTGTFANAPEGAILPVSIHEERKFRVNYVLNGSSRELRLTSVNVPTTTALIVSPLTATPSDSLALQATVMAGWGQADGIVYFSESGTILGSAPLTNGSAVLHVSGLPAGRHNLTAVFPGSELFLSSQSGPATVTINAPVTVAISSVAPSHGSAAGGTMVTIAGTNLARAASVDFGGTPAEIKSRTDSALTVVAPPHAAGDVTVTVVTPAGSPRSAYKYDPAEVEEPRPTHDETRLLPVTGSVGGNFGSYFRTAVQLQNPTSATLSGRVVFHPQSQTPSPGDPSISYTLRPGATRAFDDVVAAMNASGIGSLDVVPDSGQVAPLCLAVIFNDGGSAGTAGMTIPFVSAGDVLAQGQTGIVVAPPSLTNFRFNIGVRALSAGASADIVVRDASGAVKRSTTKSFAADSLTQVPAADLAGELAPNDAIAFTVTGGAALIYSSATDNTTQDPTYQTAARPVLNTRTLTVPVAGSLPGNFGSFFRTSLQLHNSQSDGARVRITLRQNNAPDASHDIELAAGETKYYADIVSVLNRSGIGSLDLEALDGTIPVVISRVYNDAGAKGTTGMTMDAVPAPAALAAGANAILVAPANLTDFRYNIGVRTLDAGATLQFVVRDAAGTVRETSTVVHEANYFAQTNASDVAGVQLAPNDSITVTVIEGSAIVYGATTDNRTQDPSAQIAAKF